MSGWVSMVAKWIRNYWVIRSVGLAALCGLFAWILKRWTHAGHWQLVLMIGLVVGIFASVCILQWLWRRSRGKRLEKELLSDDASPASHAMEIALLKEKMSEAIASLKSSELGKGARGRASLYALPWFVVIGPSAAGKSTLLRHSGLGFPLDQEDDLRIRGVGGTQNCDWWFSNDAILLDTAGRYTMESKDNAEWFAFLRLLKKNRPRLPLNGVVVVLSLPDLLTADEEKMVWHGQVVRSRINELYGQLGYRFPIYLIFTKCDLLSGFLDFFSILSSEEKEQVWGIPLFDDKAREGAYAADLEKLYDRLASKRIVGLGGKVGAEKLRRYRFPEQFLAATRRIRQCVELLLRPNPYRETPYLCGVYLGSGAQGGNNICHLSEGVFFNETKSPDELSEASQDGRQGYFFASLFRKIIFPGRFLVAKTRQRLLWKRRWKCLSVVASLFLVVGCFIWHSASFARSVLQLHQGVSVTRRFVEEVRNANGDHGAVVHSLLNLYKSEKALCKQGSYWSLRLLRGDVLGESIRSILMSSMKEFFLKPVRHYLEEKLKHDMTAVSVKMTTQVRADYYDALSAYLALSFPNMASSDGDLFRLFASYWRQALRLNPDDYEGMIGYYFTAAKNRGDFSLHLPINEDLVEGVRGQLRTPLNQENLYAQMIAAGNLTFMPRQLSDLLTKESSGDLYAQESIAGVYTRDAWSRFIRPWLEQIARQISWGDWVMERPIAQLARQNKRGLQAGRQEGIKKLQWVMTEEYIEHYLRAWQRFLLSVRVRTPMSLEEMGRKLGRLADARGPMQQIFEVMGDQFGLSSLPDCRACTVLKKWGRLFHVSNENNLVQAYFSELQKLQADMQRLHSGSNVARDADLYATRLLNGQVGDLEIYNAMVSINMLVNGLGDDVVRTAMRGLLLTPVRSAWQAVLKMTAEWLEQEWQDKVLAFYRQQIAGRYPFNLQAQEEASLHDVDTFLRPKTGLLWRFISEELGPFLKMDEGAWHESTWLDEGIGFDRGFLNSLLLAASIQESIFHSDVGDLGFDFRLFPIPSTQISRVALSLSGNTYQYQNGPQEWRLFHWAGDKAERVSSLSAMSLDGDAPVGVRKQGFWSWLRLFQVAKIQVLPDGQYELRWPLKRFDGKVRDVRFRLAFNGPRDGIMALWFGRFSLPRHIFVW